MSEIKTIADLTPDDRNANAGTERGQYMVAHSLEQYGAGRSILVDKSGRVIAGNKTLEAAAAMGLPIAVVPSDGRSLVVVQRTDLDLDTPEGRALAVADNRSSEVGLAWDAVNLGEIAAEVDLSGLFIGHELEKILSSLPMNLDVGDIESDDEQPATYAGGELPPSYVRMVQLFFTSETQPEFLRMAQAIMPRLGQTNLTDTVFEAVKYAYSQLDVPDAD